MDYFNIILNIVGITLTQESSDIVRLLSCILVLSVIAFLSFLNIAIYLIALYITKHPLFLDQISQWKFLVRIL